MATGTRTNIETYILLLYRENTLLYYKIIISLRGYRYEIVQAATVLLVVESTNIKAPIYLSLE